MGVIKVALSSTLPGAGRVGRTPQDALEKKRGVYHGSALLYAGHVRVVPSPPVCGPAERPF